MKTVVLKFLPMPEGSRSRRSQQLKQTPKAAPLKPVGFCSLQFNKRPLLLL